MAKKIKLEVVQSDKEKQVIAAEIKDGYCHYSYEVKQGPNTGDIHSVKGKGLVHEDMYTAFDKLKIHLAMVDGSAEDLGNDASLFTVNGFKTKGNREDETMVISGTKHVVSVNGRMSLTTPKIALAPSSPYKYWTELLELTDLLCSEVEQYMNGKFAPAEETIDPNQMTIEMNVVEVDLSSAKVD